MRTVFETSDGTVFLGCDSGLFKSTDKGQSWKQVQDEGWVMNMVESDGVLIATGQRGIMRSTNNGEHWEWVIKEGGVGIAIERVESGFAAISFNTTTETRRIRISLDRGETWTPIDEGMQPSMYIFIYQTSGKIFTVWSSGWYIPVIWHGRNMSVVRPGMIESIRIYVSGICIPLGQDPLDAEPRLLKAGTIIRCGQIAFRFNIVFSRW